MKQKVLIVDDEASIRNSLLESLTTEGYDAETAESGEEALAKCHGTVFDLVITDLRLPGVTGLDILKALRNQGNPIPVIMMTAYGDMETALKAMRGGAYDFIPKPFKLSAIKKQVKAALRATAEREATQALNVMAESAEPPAAKATSSERSGQYMNMIQQCDGLEKIARILDKIGKEGMGALTYREREMLKRATRR